MSFHLYGDELAGDVRWSKLAEGDVGPSMSQRRWESRVDALQSAYFRVTQHVAHQRDDGYIDHRRAIELCRGRTWVLDALLTPSCGKGAFLHRPGDRCPEKNCIDASPPWVAGFDYRVCGFLKKNPSRKERERNDAQKKDLSDPVLRAFLFERDGGCCRYCRSGPMKPKGMGNAKDRRRLAVVEHVDPDRDAGPDRGNVVLGCAECNEFKGRRTPDEAGMTLLPVPTTAQVAHWRARGEQQFTRPDPGDPHPADTVPDNPPDKVIDKAQTTSQTTRSAVVDHVVYGVVQHDPGTPGGDQVSAGGAQDNDLDSDREGSGSGRVGQPPTAPVLGALGQPLRDPSAPDIYHGRSRVPAGHGPPGGDPHAP